MPIPAQRPLPFEPQRVVEGARIEASADAWPAIVRRVHDFIVETDLDARKVVVILPFAQHLPLARHAWAQACPDGWMPRFETTQTLMAALPARLPHPDGATGDLVADRLAAVQLLAAQGWAEPVRRRDPATFRQWVEALTGTVHQFMQAASSVAPSEREAYWAHADRTHVRRVRALLERQHVSLRDETGWKLSTTRAGACVAGLLEMARHRVATDVVLDWLESAFVQWPGVSEPEAPRALERDMREQRAPWMSDACRALVATGAGDGEPLNPAVLLERLRLALQRAGLDEPPWNDPREQPACIPVPVNASRPRAPGLVPERLSATSYEALRACPYRFFALRMLRLQKAEELDDGIERRDCGTWLHAVVEAFHDLRAIEPLEEAAEVARLVSIAREQQQALGLDEAAFLPYAARFNQVAAFYVQWLVAHEHAGGRFEQGEVPLRLPAGGVELHGKLDRIDRASGRAHQPGADRRVPGHQPGPMAGTAQLAVRIRRFGRRSQRPASAFRLHRGRPQAEHLVRHPADATASPRPGMSRTKSWGSRKHAGWPLRSRAWWSRASIPATSTS